MSACINPVGNISVLDKILNEDFLGNRSHYVEVGPDEIILPGLYENCYESIENFDVREDDVFILGYPKTGTRWMQELTWLLLNDLDFEKATEVILPARSPFLEYEAVYNNTEMVRCFRTALGSPTRRCIKSHLHWNLLPKSLVSGDTSPKIIVLLRSPEDTCTSQFYNCTALTGCSGSWDNFCRLFLGHKTPFGSYWKYVLGMWEQKHRHNIMFVKYNRMKSDLAGTIRNVASFLRKELSDADVTNLCEHLTFDNLKNSKGFNMQEIMKLPINPFVRKGQIDDHKNVMSFETIDAFRTNSEEFFGRTELTFD